MNRLRHLPGSTSSRFLLTDRGWLGCVSLSSGMGLNPKVGTVSSWFDCINSDSHYYSINLSDVFGT
jgi:hypothetical protein